MRYKDYIISFAAFAAILISLGYFAYCYAIAGLEAENMFPMIPAFLVTAFILLGIFFSMIIVSKRGYQWQIWYLQENLDELLEGEGDLTKRVFLLNFDEIGDVCGNINKFLDFMEGFVSTVKGVVESSGESAGNLQKTVIENLSIACLE